MSSDSAVRRDRQGGRQAGGGRKAVQAPLEHVASVYVTGGGWIGLSDTLGQAAVCDPASSRWRRATVVESFSR